MSLEYLDSFRFGEGSRYVGGTAGVDFYTPTTGRHSAGHNAALLKNTTVSTPFALKRAIATPKATIAQGLAWMSDGPITSPATVMAFVGVSSTRHITLVFNGSGKLEVRRGDTSGTVLGTSDQACRPPLGAFCFVEALVTIDDTTGSVAVQVDEQQLTFSSSSSISGDTRNGGADALVYECWLAADVNSGFHQVWQDWRIWNTLGSAFNTYTGDRVVEAAIANASGSHSDGTASSGSLVSCVDDVGADYDSTYIAQANGDEDTFNVENAVANALDLEAVQLFAIVRKDDAGADTGRLVGISGATTDDGGADISVATAYQSYLRLYEKDWNGVIPWTITNFNAIEAGWKRTA